MKIPLSWEVGLALWILDLLDSEQIPEVASLGVENGMSNERLVHLAGALPTVGNSLRVAFSSAIRDLEAGLPSRPNAARVLARKIASEIVARRLDPFDGARTMGEISRAVGPDFHELDAFIYAESEAEDRPSDRAFFRDEILKAAHAWLESGFDDA